MASEQDAVFDIFFAMLSYSSRDFSALLIKS